MEFDVTKIVKLIIGAIIGLGIGHLAITACWTWALSSLEDNIKHWID